MEYTILTSRNKIELSIKVIQFLVDGWELQGGVSCSLSETNDFKYLIYAQAVIRKDN